MTVVLGDTRLDAVDVSDLTDEWLDFYADTITTAAEGGVNGWAHVIEYDWHSTFMGKVMCSDDCATDPGSVCPFKGEYANARMVVLERDEDTGDAAYEITIGHLRAAYQAILADRVPNLSDSTIAMFREAYEETDAGQIDAGLASALVEIAIFGEVVYC